MRQVEKNTEATEVSSDLEYIKCYRELEQLQAELESTNERKRNIQQVSDQLGGWIYRSAVKLNAQTELTHESEITVEGKLMSELFNSVYNVVVRRLADIKLAEREFDYDQADPSVFRNEDYIKQNIRVNAEASVIDEMASQIRFGESVDSGDDEKKYNRDAHHDLQKMRDHVKLMYDNYVERKEREIAEEIARKEGREIKKR